VLFGSGIRLLEGVEAERQDQQARRQGVAAVVSNYWSVGSTLQAQSPWRRWILPSAAVIGAGPWGGLAGATLFWLAGRAVGVTFADPGLLNFRFWPFMWLLLGLTLGFAASAHLALRLVQRSPRVLGGILVLWAVLMLSITLADSSGWDWLYVWVPGAVLAAAVVRRRTRRT
jgi:hypothetical protein